MVIAGTFRNHVKKWFSRKYTMHRFRVYLLCWDRNIIFWSELVWKSPQFAGGDNPHLAFAQVSRTSLTLRTSNWETEIVQGTCWIHDKLSSRPLSAEYAIGSKAETSLFRCRETHRCIPLDTFMSPLRRPQLSKLIIMPDMCASLRWDLKRRSETFYSLDPGTNWATKPPEIAVVACTRIPSRFGWAMRVCRICTSSSDSCESSPGFWRSTLNNRKALNLNFPLCSIELDLPTIPSTTENVHFTESSNNVFASSSSSL